MTEEIEICYNLINKKEAPRYRNNIISAVFPKTISSLLLCQIPLTFKILFLFFYLKFKICLYHKLCCCVVYFFDKN